MKDITQRRYRSVRRRLSVLLMAAASVGIVWLAGWWYATARAAYLTPQDGSSTPVPDGTPLAVDAMLLEQYGVQAVSRTAEGQYVVVSTVQGYKSAIRVRTVFSPDAARVYTMQVLAQNETEYLGERVQTQAFAAQFAGRRAPLKLWQAVTRGSPIDALSGATISSQAVVDAVNNAYFLLNKIG